MPKPQTTDPLRGKLEAIKRGVEAVLLDAALADDPINPDVLLRVRDDIDEALKLSWSCYAPF